nr:unnamed protein product [Ipomoea batatas]
MQPFEYLMPIFADEEDLIASSDNTLGSGEAHGASKDLDICSLKLIGLHHRFQEMEFLKAAQIYDFLHRPFILFLLRERLAQESRQLLDVDDSVCLQILVPQEQHFVGELDTGFVVGSDVIPVGAERRDPARESVESLLERNGGNVFGGELACEVPQRNQNVLGIAKHVNNPTRRRGGVDVLMRKGLVGNVGVKQGGFCRPWVGGVFSGVHIQMRDQIMRI